MLSAIYLAIFFLFCKEYRTYDTAMSLCPYVPSCLSVCIPLLPKALWCIRNYFESYVCPHSCNNSYKIIITDFKSLLMKHEFWFPDVAVTARTFGTFLRIRSEQLTAVNSIVWRTCFSNRKIGNLCASSELTYRTKIILCPRILHLLFVVMQVINQCTERGVSRFCPINNQYHTQKFIYLNVHHIDGCLKYKFP
jgi:hypothetical protein